MDELFYELFDGMHRLGPGTDEATLKALSFIPKTKEEMKVLDLGCGTGAQTFVLAKELSGKIIALDNYQPFLDHIQSRAERENTGARIKCVCMDMKHIVCKHESLDLVWAEGSIYIIGFENGLKTIWPLMKPGAYAVLSDMNYLKPDPPRELTEFMQTECPDMISKEANLDLIHKSDFNLVDHFELGKEGHWDTYYEPLQRRVDSFREKYFGHPRAIEIAESIQTEIDLFRKYSTYYGYVFYILKKPA